MALGKFKLALRDFESVKKRRPRDPDAQVMLYMYSFIVLFFVSLRLLLCVFSSSVVSS